MVLLCTCRGQRRIWDKATASTQAQLGTAVKMPVPRFDDVKLLVACMAWPPSVFVSDATDAQGALPPLSAALCR